ncbi:site-specific integrase [Paraprevotella clara]|uniref:site-specific integrase n=1 Tax=Paraprevotella clara TaxID=454154 RepID=UPI0020518559|nr:site-specific integrase [Paraprevotella clara]DAJ72434.1 MAG TPA: Integrase [Caudoviricetes sp.]
MKILLRLSSKINMGGMSEIMLSANNRIGDKVVTLRAKSEVYIMPVFFSQEKGIDMSRKKLIAPDVRIWHNEAKCKLDGILSSIAHAEETARKEDMIGDWLKKVVEKHLHPERYQQESSKKSMYDLWEEYLFKKNLSNGRIRGIRVLIRSIARYEGFIRATEKDRKDFVFDINKVTKDDIGDFMDYLRNEENLSNEYRHIFKVLLERYPSNIEKGKSEIKGRGENTVITLMKKLKAFFNWLYESDKTSNRPFDGFKIGTEKYGTPYYISVDERNLIARTPMPTKHLETQRDIFIFHCFVGCRVSDLIKLTEANITEGILTYTPHKTKDEGEQAVVARVPLHENAIKLIDKYRGTDKKGRLFPFISPQKYNDAIKEIFTIAGITRSVEIRNARTGEMEVCPINEIASSHIARRTFVGNAYRKVSDPNIIGKMSGHVEGSKAFNRYRNIEDETLKNVIDLIG